MKMLKKKRGNYHADDFSTGYAKKRMDRYCYMISTGNVACEKGKEAMQLAFIQHKLRVVGYTRKEKIKDHAAYSCSGGK